MRRAVLLLFLLAAGAAGYSAYWFILADNLKTGVAVWADAQRAHGYAVSWESVALDGYPGAFRLHFRRAAADGGSPLLQLAVPVLEGEARPWNLRRWRVGAAQGLSLTAPGEGTGLVAGAVDGWVATDAEGGTAIDLIAQRVAGTGLAAGFSVANAAAQVTVSDRPPATGGPQASASFRLANLKLPAPVPPLSDAIEALALQGTVQGALPPSRLRDALAIWHQRGGSVEITGASLRWDALTIDATGTLALDDELQPVGALSATVVGESAIVDAVVAMGKLRPDNAQLIKRVLALAATSGPDGKRQLTLPVTLKNRRVYLGPAQVATLPRLTWE